MEDLLLMDQYRQASWELEVVNCSMVSVDEGEEEGEEGG